MYEDRAIYLRALVGEDIDRAIAHFDGGESDPNRDGFGPAEVLIDLLTRLERYEDALKPFDAI